MWRFLSVILLIGVFVLAVKVALILVFFVCLIFKTKETIGVITILAVIAGFNAHPAVGFALLGLIGAIALYRNSKKPNEDSTALPAPED